MASSLDAGELRYGRSICEGRWPKVGRCFAQAGRRSGAGSARVFPAHLRGSPCGPPHPVFGPGSACFHQSKDSKNPLTVWNKNQQSKKSNIELNIEKKFQKYD